MRRILLLCGAVLAVSGCASTPVLEPFAPKGFTGPQGTVWADNGHDYFLMIKKIDGKRTPSRGGNGFPYSARLSPGDHTLSLYVSNDSLSNGYVFLDYYANLEISLNVVEGHNYALRLSPSKTHAIVEAIDLGFVSCSYKITGKMARGYVPVTLDCQ